MVKINVLSLTEDPRPFTAEVSPAVLGTNDEVRWVGPVMLACEIYRQGQKVIIRGQVSARAELECSRCLQPVTVMVDGPLDLVAVPAVNAAPAAERELQEDDVALTVYTGDQLDLIPELKTALILALPMKPLCAEDCPGLCPDCGQRRPQDGLCQCGQAKSEGPFEALKKYREHPPSAN